MLSVRSVTKRYGEARALDGVSLELERGQVLAVVGANGAGKTTLIKCILGLVHHEGQVLIDGFDAARQGKEARRLAGYLPQDTALHADLTVQETAAFYAALKKVASGRARAAVESAGLGGHMRKPVGALSGGMRQRLALAITLLADPPLLVLDEPASSLDVAARADLRRLVQEQRAAGKAVVLSTHWLEDVPRVADDALLLDHGRAAYHGPASRLGNEGVATSRLYLHLNGKGPEAVPVINTLTGGHVERNGDWLLVRCAAGEKPRVIEGLVAAGIGILDFRVEDAPIEDVILGLRGQAGGNL